jgi:hypothetical protein
MPKGPRSKRAQCHAILLSVAAILVCCGVFLNLKFLSQRATNVSPAFIPKEVSAGTLLPTNVVIRGNTSTASGPRHHQRKTTYLLWNHSVYLPVSHAAREGFQAYDARLRKRLRKSPWLHRVWGCQSRVAAMLLGDVPLPQSSDPNQNQLYNSMPPPVQRSDVGLLRDRLFCARNDSGQSPRPHLDVGDSTQRAFGCGCLLETPECEFFLHVGNATVAFVKCCVEHFKLKLTLRNVAIAVQQHNDSKTQHGVQLFLDSGSLLSSVRDGGSTLLPWETDIDLGVVSGDPNFIASLLVRTPAAHQLRTSRPHYVETCAVDHATGICKDAHYVYFVLSKLDAKNDTSRVEIWPLHPNNGQLHHPTRPWLTVQSTVVLPLRRCTLWSIPLWCPANSEAYLDHEYGGRKGWIVPRTIHWGERNVQSWR